MRGLLEQFKRNPDVIAIAAICLVAVVPMPKLSVKVLPEPVRPAMVWKSAPMPEPPRVVVREIGPAVRDALRAREEALILMENLRAERAAHDREGYRNHEEND